MDGPYAHCDRSLKGIVIGESGTGKTSILRQFVRGEYQDGGQATLGVEYTVKVLMIKGGGAVSEGSEERVELQLWDTAGQEKYRSVVSAYYRGSVIVYLIYSIVDRLSFDAIGRWLADVRRVVDQNDAAFVLIGNKADLAEHRQVPRDDAAAFARTHEMLFWETSAKTGFNIAEALQSPVFLLRGRPGWMAGVAPPDERVVFDEAPPLQAKSGRCC